MCSQVRSGQALRTYRSGGRLDGHHSLGARWAATRPTAVSVAPRVVTHSDTATQWAVQSDGRERAVVQRSHCGDQCGRLSYLLSGSPSTRPCTFETRLKRKVNRGHSGTFTAIRHAILATVPVPYGMCAGAVLRCAALRQPEQADQCTSNGMRTTIGAVRALVDATPFHHRR
jgi:hypothetical protein